MILENHVFSLSLSCASAPVILDKTKQKEEREEKKEGIAMFDC
jgi:hypothetical protein